MRWTEAAVCPECAYPVRTRETARCPECGQAYPGPWGTRLRWARRRLPIERRTHRGLWPWAWLQTVLLVTFRPFSAARRIAVPNRTASAVLFALAGILCSAALLTLCSQSGLLLALRIVHAANLARSFEIPDTQTRDQLLAQCGFTAATWALLMLLAVGVGLAIANGVCQRRAAGFATTSRWCCYATVVFLWASLGALHTVRPVYRYVRAKALATTAGLAATPLGVSGVAPSWLSTPIPTQPAQWTNPPASFSRLPPIPTAANMPPPLPPLEWPRLWVVSAREGWLGWSDLTCYAFPVLSAYGAWMLIGLLNSPHRDRRRPSVIALVLISYAAIWVVLSAVVPWWGVSLALR